MPLALVIGYLAWGRLVQRVQHRKMLCLSVGLLALYPISTALIPSALWLPAVALVWGIAASGVDIGLFDLMLAAAPRDRMPRLASLLKLAVSAASFVGPLLGVALSEATSVRTALIIVGVIQLVTVIGFRLLPGDV